MDMKNKFGMYDEVKEKFTGFEGIVLGITFYNTGCVHYGLCPQKLDKEGRPMDWWWVDETRLVLKKMAKVEKPAKVGGPMSNPPMASQGRR